MWRWPAVISTRRTWRTSFRNFQACRRAALSRPHARTGITSGPPESVGISTHFPFLQDAIRGTFLSLRWRRAMSNGKKGIPENSSVVMPRLYCRDVAAEVDFCKTVFDAVQLNLRPGPDGKAAHALMTIDRKSTRLN